MTSPRRPPRLIELLAAYRGRGPVGATADPQPLANWLDLHGDLLAEPGDVAAMTRCIAPVLRHRYPQNPDAALGAEAHDIAEALAEWWSALGGVPALERWAASLVSLSPEESRHVHNVHAHPLIQFAPGLGLWIHDQTGPSIGYGEGATDDPAAVVDIVVSYDGESDSVWVYEGDPADADESDHDFGGQVPAAMWERLDALARAEVDLRRKVIAAAGMDPDTGEPVEVCDVWQGDTRQAHEWWVAVLPASDAADTFPLLPVDVLRGDSEDALRTRLAGLPETFHLLPWGAPDLVTVHRDHLTIEPRHISGSETDCYRCGRPRRSHPAPDGERPAS